MSDRKYSLPHTITNMSASTCPHCFSQHPIVCLGWIRFLFLHFLWNLRVFTSFHAIRSVSRFRQFAPPILLFVFMLCCPVDLFLLIYTRVAPPFFLQLVECQLRGGVVLRSPGDAIPYKELKCVFIAAQSTPPAFFVAIQASLLGTASSQTFAAFSVATLFLFLVAFRINSSDFERVNFLEVLPLMLSFFEFVVLYFLLFTEWRGASPLLIGLQVLVFRSGDVLFRPPCITLVNLRLEQR